MIGKVKKESGKSRLKDMQFDKANTESITKPAFKRLASRGGLNGFLLSSMTTIVQS